MRQVGEIFLCYGSIHKQPPLAAAGKCRITCFKAPEKEAHKAFAEISAFGSPEIRMFCQTANGGSAQTRGCGSPMII